MGKRYLQYIFILLCLNFMYKGAKYLTYKKTEGIVTGYSAFMEVSHSSGRKSFSAVTTAPEITYTINGTVYTEALKKWGGFCLPDVGDRVILLYKDDPEVPELNRFLQYWLTFGQIVATLLLSAALLMITETIKEFKKRKSRSVNFRIFL